MNISNTQVPQTPHQQPSVESLVGNQKQEYPKPSVPAESNPTEAETTKRNTETDLATEKKEDKPKQNDTGLPRDLDNTQGVANLDTAKIQQDVKESNIKSSQELSRDSIKELKDLQEIITKQKGAQTYASNMGIMSN